MDWSVYPSMDPSLLLHLILCSISSVLGCVPTRPTSTPSPVGRYPPVFHARSYLPLDDLPLLNASLTSLTSLSSLPSQGNDTGVIQEVSSNISFPSDPMTASLLSVLSSLPHREDYSPSVPALRTLMQWLATLAPLHNPPSNDTVTTTTTLTPTTTTTVIPGMNTTTVTSTTTTTTAPTTTTTVAPTDCCPALTQTPTSIDFPDGVMSFTYNSNSCRSTVSAFCTQTDPAFNLYAAIVANGDNFLDYQPNNVTFPGNCVGGTWFMGTPPLAIVTLECRLTNPPSTTP